MIARVFIPLLLIIILPDVYLWLHRLRRPVYSWAERLLWLAPSALMIVFSGILAVSPSFVPDDIYWAQLYIALLGVWVVPKLVYVLCSAIGLAICRLAHSRRNWGRLVGIGIAGYMVYAFVYGYTIGFADIEVKHVTLAVDNLPKEFDGLRVAHLSDAHVGTYTGRRAQILSRAVDSTLAQRPDLICFTGDIQNVKPAELEPVMPMLARLKAPLGVYSVLGNHDYATYLGGTDEERSRAEQRLCQMERGLGWHLLLNDNCVIRRGSDSIFIAGMENDGEPPFPSRGDVGKTMRGIPAGAFTLMLEHDPSSWTRTILPHSTAQVTLSGHTHGGQIELFGLRFTQLRQRHDLGLYREGQRWLYVNAGLGGVVPMRYHVNPEITIITLTTNKS